MRPVWLHPYPTRAQKTQIRRRRRLLKKMPPSRHVDRHSRQPPPTKGLRSAHVFSDRYMRGRSLGGPRVRSELPRTTCLPDISPQGSPRRVHALPRISSNTQESRAVPSLLWSSLVCPTLLHPLRNPACGNPACGQASGLTRAYLFPLTCLWPAPGLPHTMCYPRQPLAPSLHTYPSFSPHVTTRRK